MSWITQLRIKNFFSRRISSELLAELHCRLYDSMHQLPPFFIERWQSRYLAFIVRHAYFSIPMYRKYWHEHGVDPLSIISLEDLPRLPVISKQMIRALPLEETVDARYKSLPTYRYTWKDTTGSTGEPFRVLALMPPPTKSGSHMLMFKDYRFIAWKGKGLREVIDKMRIAQIRMNPHPTPNYLFIPVSSLRSDPRAELVKLRQFKPDIVSASPTVLIEFVRIADSLLESERFTFPYTIVHSEVLTPSHRQDIQRVFGTEVYDHYGLVEVGWVGNECVEHNGYHINEESMVIEIVDESGIPQKSGEWGRVIVSEFYNTLMPFIRYDTGDWGMILPEECPCGIPTKRLKVTGRVGAYLDLGGGRFFDFEFRAILRNFTKSIVRYQIAKTGANTVALYVIPTKDFTDKDSSLLSNLFAKHFNFVPEVKLVDSIPYTDTGKTISVIDFTKDRVSPVKQI